MMYKIIHEILDLTLPEYFTFNRGITRGHEYKLTIPIMRIDPYRFSFLPFHYQTLEQPITSNRPLTFYHRI